MNIDPNDEELKEAIKKYQNEVHAPSDLIKVTKQKVAKEEKKTKIHKFTYVISACAAILVLFLLSTGLSNLEFFIHQKNGTELRLGNLNEEKVYLDDEVEMEKTKVLSMEFQSEDPETLQIGDVIVKIVCSNDGCYMASYEEEDNYIILRSKETDKEKFILIITEILNK